MLLIWLYNDPSEEEVNAQLAQNNMQSMEFLLQQVDNGVIKKMSRLVQSELNTQQVLLCLNTRSTHRPSP